MRETLKPSRPSLLLLWAFVPLALGASAGCKKDEPPPPLPTASSAAPAAEAAPIELVPEELPAPSASASAAAPKPGGGAASSIKKCCGALTQNAANAPEPNKTYMLQAAAVCNAAAGAGQASGAAFGAITAALRGAGMPAACK